MWAGSQSVAALRRSEVRSAVGRPACVLAVRDVESDAHRDRSAVSWTTDSVASGRWPPRSGLMWPVPASSGRPSAWPADPVVHGAHTRSDLSGHVCQQRCGRAAGRTDRGAEKARYLLDAIIHPAGGYPLTPDMPYWATRSHA